MSTCLLAFLWSWCERQQQLIAIICFQIQSTDNCNCLSNLGRGEARCSDGSSVDMTLICTLMVSCCFLPVALLPLGPEKIRRKLKVGGRGKEQQHLTYNCYHWDTAWIKIVYCLGGFDAHLLLFRCQTIWLGEGATFNLLRSNEDQNGEQEPTK